MASATGFLANGKDLNQIFAPIGVNGIDYGTIPNYTVQETWVPFNNLEETGAGKNIEIITGGFKITSPGLYRLNISLNVGNANESTQNVVFILADTNIPPSYDFVASPDISTIYAINCSGANGTDTVNATNNLNNINLGNCLSLNPTQKSFSLNPYFFSFTLQKSSTGSSISRSNFFTLDITFRTSFKTGQNYQNIYPYIRCRQSSSNPVVVMQNSTWRFIKLNNMPA